LSILDFFGIPSATPDPSTPLRTGLPGLLSVRKRDTLCGRYGVADIVCGRYRRFPTVVMDFGLKAVYQLQVPNALIFRL